MRPPAGYCGLYKLGLNPEDPSAGAALSGPLDSARLLDIRDYCANASAHAALVMLALGFILHAATALAVAHCSHGLRLGLGPLARWVGSGRRRRQQRRQQQRKETPAGVVAP